MQEKIIDLINDSIRNFSNISNDEHMISLIEQISDIIISALDNKNKLLLCGNGGSAADAQHIAAELSGRFEMDRKALNAQALHVNSSYLTAVANDYGFEDVYSRMIEASAKSGDVLIALSTSGNSKNVINAIKKANEMENSIGFSGNDGGAMKDICKYNFVVPSYNTARFKKLIYWLGILFVN